MTRWLAAARQAQLAGTQLTQPTKLPLKEVSSVMSVLSEGVRDAAARFGGGQAPVPTPRPADIQENHQTRHGVSVAGYPLTWTGRVVSLDEWRRLTAWERHGPDGRMWNGLSGQWIEIGRAEK